MRLLNVETMELEDFYDAAIPCYAILSHTWEKGEPTLQNFQSGRARDMGGYGKIKLASRQALRDKLNYVWVDAICIDKTSSVELSEAINSMFRWYADSVACYAYLVDVETRNGIIRSRWFTPGWTLQEFLAPSEVKFYDRSWQYLGSKADKDHEEHTLSMRSLLLEATTILLSHERVLDSFQPDEWSVAEKLSWAANRATTRKEDTAYCLLGVFGVHMPLIYGQGDRSFFRLQEEVLRTSDDHSLFAWTDEDVALKSLCGLLSISPCQFKDVYRLGNAHWRSRVNIDMHEPSKPYTMTNQGIRFTLTLIPHTSNDASYYALLGCSDDYRPANHLTPKLLIANQRRTIIRHELRVALKRLMTSSREIFMGDLWETRRSGLVFP